MIKNWVTWISLGIAGLAAFLLLIGAGIYLFRPSTIPITEIPPEKKTLPPGAFAFENEKYDAIGPPFMSLRYSPMSLQLPDLRNVLVYYGRNERPDASDEQSLLHFAFVGSKEVDSVLPENPLYLVYDKSLPRIKYRFSTNNTPTSLWIEATPGDKSALVNVSMTDESGKVIRKPEAYAQFELKEKEFSRFRARKWELGKWKVDGTLLARQKARWYGTDKFLERHGGEEYSNFSDKQKIQFGEDEDRYTVYIGPTDALAWKEGRWTNIEPGEESRQYPLMVVNKIDERLMKLDLWNVDGESKVTLNLIRSRDTSMPRNLEKTFKFVGARTRSQLLFEVKGERMMISPQDWLIYHEKDWKKLVTPQDIDAYVEGKISGPLFVVDGVENVDGRQVLKGVLFSDKRSEMENIEIPLQQGPVAPPPPPPRGRNPQAVPQGEEEPNREDRERMRERYIERLRERLPESFDTPGVRGRLSPFNK